MHGGYEVDEHWFQPFPLAAGYGVNLYGEGRRACFAVRVNYNGEKGMKKSILRHEITVL